MSRHSGALPDSVVDVLFRHVKQLCKRHFAPVADHAADTGEQTSEIGHLALIFPKSGGRKSCGRISAGRRSISNIENLDQSALLKKFRWWPRLF